MRQSNVHHMQCINVVSKHIFPKNALQMQKHHLQKVHDLHSFITICEYFVCWHQQNDYLALFPPHGGAAQKIRDDKIIKLIYKRLLNHMKSDLECMNNFDINAMDMMHFHEVLECLKLSYQLEKKLEKTKKLEASKKDSEKHNGECSGKKHANTTNEALPVSTKKPCLLHGTLSHTTVECEVMKEQANKMKVTYKMQTPVKHAKKYQEWKAKKAPTHDEINEMMSESVKKSVKEIFQTHMKTLKKHSHEDTNSDSDSEHENYCMEDVGLDLKDINVSETFALSDLHRPPQKCQKLTTGLLCL